MTNPASPTNTSTQVALPTLRDHDRWVSCSADTNLTVAANRHIIGRGPTTVCGATGLGARVWRGNSTKQPCPVCVRTYAASGPAR